MAEFDVRMLDGLLPRWWIWNERGTPGVGVSLPVNVRNRGGLPVTLVSAHLEGTQDIRFQEDYVVAPNTEADTFLGARMLPVVAKEGEVLTGEVVFIDSDGNRHNAGTASFVPPPGIGPPVGQVLTCGFCGDSIAVADYYTFFGGSAHRGCIWKMMRLIANNSVDS